MIESKGYKITPIDGDLAVSRNAEIGRDVDIQGKARVAGSLKVEGFLDAPNIKGVVKGLFVTEEELKREYPNPRPGYCAIVLADSRKGFLYIAKNRGWEKQSEEAEPFDFIVDSISVFASKGELADETARAQEAERILAQGIVTERTRAEAEENKIKQQAAKYDRIGFNESADKIELYAGSIDGSVHYADIFSATHEKAGVMTAMDKTNLDNSTVKSITWNNDTNPSNINDFVVAGVYDIKGEHTREDDNLPVLNTGSGHTFNARLTVLDSSIPGSGEDDDKCITQVMSFNNRLGQGEVYIRTGKGASLDNLTWEKWSTLQRNVNVGEVGSLDDLKDNGIYSGVWKQGRIDSNYLAFVCIVINDYFIGTAPRRISQFVYGLSKFDGSVVYQSRVWDDSKDKWGDWEILNQKEIASMISAEIKKVTDGIDPNKIDSLKDIITWIEEHGDVANILAAIQGLSDELGQEIEARISADNTTRSMGVLFGGFSNRQTTAAEVVIGYKSIDQEHEGTFSIPAATTEKAGVMTAADKKKLDSLSPGGDVTTEQLEEAIEKGRQLALRSLFIAAGAEYNDTDEVIKKTAFWGEEVDHLPHHYYLNGLGDITEEQMAVIYSKGNTLNLGYNLNGYTGRTNLPLLSIKTTTNFEGYFYAKGCFAEVINLGAGIYSQVSFNSSDKTEHTFSDCSKLKVIWGKFYFNAAPKNTTFYNSKLLQYINITKLKYNISFYTNPIISKESIMYMIQNATPSSAITITLHANAYARLANDVDIVAALEAQPLITLVSA